MKLYKQRYSAAASRVRTASSALAAPIGGGTAVFLRTGGGGDGSTEKSPVGTLEAAFAALDLTKDCTVIICGEFVQSRTFIHTEKYSGSVTFTSVYDGVDYRKTAGAVFVPGPTRFICTGETIFRDIDFYLQREYFLVIAAHNPVTVDTGVTVRSMRRGFDGQSLASGFSILGGYQCGQRITKKGALPPPKTDLAIDITVNSGKNIVILPHARGFKAPTASGEVHVTVGEAAQAILL